MSTQRHRELGASLPAILEGKIVVYGLLLISLCVLMTFGALSAFAFPSADDFCYAVKARALGFVGAQRDMYFTWSGRYSASAAISAFVLAGGLQRFYPHAAVLVLLLTAAAFVALLLALGWPKYPLRILLAGSLALCVQFIAGLPDVAQAVYWVAGSFTYQLGNVFLLLLLALVAQQERGAASGWLVPGLRFAAGSILALVAVGENEVTLVCTLIVLATCAALAWLWQRRTIWFLTSLLAVAIVGALISVLAPGNMVRAASLSTDGMIRPSAWLAVSLFLPWTLLRIVYWLSNPALWASAFLLVVITWDDAKSILQREGDFDRRWLIVPACWAGLLFILNGVGFLVNRYPLPERAESVVLLAFLIGWYPSVVVLYHRFLPAWPPSFSHFAMRWALALLVVGLVGAPNVVEAFKDVYRGYRYHREMSARLALISESKARGNHGLEVPSISRPPRTLFATELTTDTSNFRNSCTAGYYGLPWIRLGDSQ
jgi:hypothetical protein